jgi:hypothetical protein
VDTIEEEHTFITESADQARLLMGVIDNWVEGFPAAEDATIQDASIKTPEELLDLMAGYHEDAELLKRFRERLVRDVERHEYDRRGRA